MMSDVSDSVGEKPTYPMTASDVAKLADEAIANALERGKAIGRGEVRGEADDMAVRITANLIRDARLRSPVHITETTDLIREAIQEYLR